MANSLIALVDVEGKTANNKTVSFKKGQYVGDLTKNNNNVTLLVNNLFNVNAESVAIIVQPEAKIQDTSLPVKTPNEVKNDSNNKVKKIISIALIGGGIYAFMKGNRAIGISLFVFGLIMGKKIINN